MHPRHELVIFENFALVHLLIDLHHAYHVSVLPFTEMIHHCELIKTQSLLILTCKVSLNLGLCNALVEVKESDPVVHDQKSEPDTQEGVPLVFEVVVFNIEKFHIEVVVEREVDSV